MLESVLAIPFWIEFAGTLTGGLAGGVAAARARYDMFGTVTIAIVTGLGGGIVRDVLLQDFGIYSFQHPVLILTCAVAGVAVFYFHKLADAFDWVMDFLDNLSVGLWAVVSVGKALSAGQDIVPSIILGTITAVGGGIMRDVLMARPPLAFQAGTLYGTAALAGSTAFALMKQHDVMGDYAAITCVGIVLALRYASEFFGWSTKPSQDYSDRIIEPVKKVAHVATKPVKKAAHAATKPVKKAVIEPVKDAVERRSPQRRAPKERATAHAAHIAAVQKRNGHRIANGEDAASSKGGNDERRRKNSPAYARPSMRTPSSRTRARNGGRPDGRMTNGEKAASDTNDREE